MNVEWTATPAQQETLDRLLALYEGGLLVRSLPEGRLEVLTERRGALGRHVVAADGSSALVESRPPTWRRWGAPLTWYLGAAMFLGFGIGLGVQDAGGDATWWTIAPMFIGFIGCAVGLVLMPRPHELAERGERWAEVGFPEE